MSNYGCTCTENAFEDGRNEGWDEARANALGALDTLASPVPAEQLAALMHDEFARAARRNGYQTGEVGQEQWSDLPESLRATNMDLLRYLLREIDRDVAAATRRF